MKTEHPWYHARVLQLESEGCCTSDAQGIADAEEMQSSRVPCGCAGPNSCHQCDPHFNPSPTKRGVYIEGEQP